MNKMCSPLTTAAVVESDLSIRLQALCVCVCDFSKNLFSCFYILTEASSPSPLSRPPHPLSPPHSIHASSTASLQIRVGTPRILASHGTSSCSETRHFPFHQGWMRKSGETNGFQKQATELEASRLSLLGVSPEDQVTAHIFTVVLLSLYMYACESIHCPSKTLSKLTGYSISSQPLVL